MLGPGSHAPSASSSPTPNAFHGPYASARVAWRGDGKFFATLCHEPLAEQQQQHQGLGPAGVDGVAEGAGAGSVCGPVCVRVWDREALELHAVGQAAGGLAAVAAWQPNGRHLYVAAQCDRWGNCVRAWQPCTCAIAQRYEAGRGIMRHHAPLPCPVLVLRFGSHDWLVGLLAALRCELGCAVGNLAVGAAQGRV